MSLLYRLTFRIPFTARVMSLLPPAGDWQHGLWIDRQSDRCTVLGLERVLLYIERTAGAPLLRYCP